MDSNQPPVRPEDHAHEEWVNKQNSLTMRAMIMTLAVCIAPFLALPFGIVPALIVLDVGLLFTAWLCWAGSLQVGTASRNKLRTAAILNLVMALIVFAIVLILVTS